MYRRRSPTHRTKKWQTRLHRANLHRLRTLASRQKKSPTSSLNQNNPKRKRNHQQHQPHPLQNPPLQNPPLRNQTPCRDQILPHKTSAVQQFPENVVQVARPRIVLQTGICRTAVRRRQRIRAHRRSDDEVALRLVVEDGRAIGAHRMSRRCRLTRKGT
jgi:hypothetical protein